MRRALMGRREVESRGSGGHTPAEPSAAQNRTVIQTCRQCGALHGANATVCDVCRALLPQNGSGRSVRDDDVHDDEARGDHGKLELAGSVARQGAGDPNWRGEVSQRLHAYRKRQQRLREGTSQLAFQPAEEAEESDPVPAFDAAAHRDVPIVTFPAAAVPQSTVPEATIISTYAPQPVPPTVPQTPWRAQASSEPAPLRRSVSARSRNERIEIDLLQPSLDFDRSDFAGNDSSKNDFAGSAIRSQSERRGSQVLLASPIASLRERRLAVMLDAGLLLTAYSSFLALFWLLGGSFVVSKMDGAVLGATLGLFYAQYFTLFTFFGGATPGMMWRGLHLTRFDGGEILVSDRIWRTFGYFVSAATLMLGFMWALWDEDRLCWHDRISHTHLTWTDAQQQHATSAVSPARGHSNASQPQHLHWRRSL
jgi:uncharacterized RDD family membrane protein YckC/ribosomal protein L40E